MDIDEIVKIIHELREIKTIVNVCKNLHIKNIDLLNKSDKRIRELEREIDYAANHNSICYKEDCQYRQKFIDKDSHESNHGSWP